jgi:DNA-binding transcriptional MocR family regulator
MDRNGQPSSPCKFVLVGPANQAGPVGTAVFPSVRTLMQYTGLSERTVRTCLDRLEAEGIIAPCDPDIVAARIKRADRRPQGWDLNLSLARDDLDDAGLAVLEYQFPGLGQGRRG